VGTAATIAQMPAAPDPAANRITPRSPMQATNGSGTSSQPPIQRNDDFGDRMARLTPPPVTPYPPSGAGQPAQAHTGATGRLPAAPAPGVTAPMPTQGASAQASPESKSGPGGKGGAAFRETLWFKKGDVEHMIAEARAKMANQGAKAAEPEVSPLEDEVKPVEDRYVDDGSVTSEDRKKFSLRTGGTATAMPTARPAQVPGESMTEHDVIREVSGSRRAIVIAVAAIVVVAVVAAVLMMMRGKPMSAAPAKAPAAVAVPAPPPAPPAGAAGALQAKPPETPGKTAKRDTKIVAAPPSSKRPDGSDKRSRRDRKKRR